MYLQNIQSLTAHIDELDQFVASSNPDVMCVTETHVTEEIEDQEIRIANYDTVRVNSKSRYTGGVIFYVKKGIKYKLIRTDIMEMQYWIGVLKVIVGKKSMILVGVYRSPSGSEADFISNFELLFNDTLENIREPVLVLGDFNINYDSRAFYANKLRSTVNDIGYKQIVSRYTHLGVEGQESLIDLVITNDSDIKECEFPKQPVFNRHSLIKITINLDKGDTKLVVRKKLQDINELSHKIKQISFDYREVDYEKKVLDYYSKIMSVMDEVMPKTVVQIKGVGKPWITYEIRQMMRERDELYGRFAYTRERNDWNLYKRVRNDVVRITRESKRMYYRWRVDESKNDSKAMWKFLKSVIANGERGNYHMIESGGKHFTSVKDIANEFNRYFIQSIDDIEFKEINDKQCYEMKGKSLNDHLDNFRLIDYDELKKIVFGFKNKSSPDELSPEMYKLLFEELKQPLLHIINYSLEKGKVPDHLRLSTVIPIRKVRNTVKIEEFRPVNMLPSMAKILEKVVYDQLMEHVQRNNILDRFQSGFRVNHSCEMALQYLLNEWKCERDNGNVVVVIFLDLKRAFETVDRNRLLKKLEKYGVAESALGWFGSYLSDRKQKVKCSEVESEILGTKKGVPQGSILGPLLFLLYINDIGSSLRYCRYHLFADDTVIYLTGKDREEVCQRMSEDLNRLHAWLETNYMKLNVRKTRGMLLGQNKVVELWKERGFTLMVDGECIELVEEYKYLGVIVDRELNFGSHVDYVCRKIAKKIGVMSRCRNTLSEWSRRIIFNTIVLPHFVFGATILYLARMSDLKRMQVLQNRAMRVIIGCDRYTRIEWMLERLGWIRVGELLECAALSFIHKTKCGKVPGYFEDILTQRGEVHEYDTRQKGHFNVKKYRYEKNKNSLFYRAVVQYNQLPEEYKSMEVRKFDRSIKKYYESYRK